MSRKNISAGSAPIIWSAVDDAFENINSNFQELYSSIGDIGSVDFEALNSNVTPSDNNTYSLGSYATRWNHLYLNGSLSIGNAEINSSGTAISLPAGTTVGGSLVIDPDKSFFKEILVDDDFAVVADRFSDSISFSSGTAISLVVASGSDRITFNNTGVTSVNGGAAISVSANTGGVIITNTGVTSATAGLGITVSAATGGITVANSGIVTIEAGLGLSVGARDPVTGKVIITNTSPAVNAYRNIAVSGEATLTANSLGATFTFIEGAGVNITTNPAAGALTDRVTFANTGVLSLTATKGITLSGSTGNITVEFDNNVDIVGSVFADDSTVLVNAGTKVITAAGGFVGNVTGNVTGNLTGNVTGNLTGNVTGDVKGSLFGDDSSALVDATSSTFYGTLDGNITRTTALTITSTGTTLVGSLRLAVQDLGGLATGNVTLTASQITGNLLTGLPLVSNRDLNLPNAGATVAGMRLLIKNRSGTYTITVKDASAATITTVATSGVAEIACDGNTWFVI